MPRKPVKMTKQTNKRAENQNRSNKETQTEGYQKIKYLGKQRGTNNASITNRMQEVKNNRRNRFTEQKNVKYFNF